MRETVGSRLRRATEALTMAGIDGARLDAQLLLASLLGGSRLDLILAEHEPLNAEIAAAFDLLLARRLRREPLSHILGHREFWSLDFKVTEATLAPRPDSETLIEAALDHYRGKAPPHSRSRDRDGLSASDPAS